MLNANKRLISVENWKLLKYKTYPIVGEEYFAAHNEFIHLLDIKDLIEEEPETFMRPFSRADHLRDRYSSIEDPFQDNDYNYYLKETI